MIAGMPDVTEAVNSYETSSGLSEVSPSGQAEPVKFPENYPEDLFPINGKDVVTVARKHDYGDVTEYSFIVESQRSIEEIADYYEEQWGPRENSYKSTSATSFELYGSIKGYDVRINGSISEEATNKVEYYVYVIKYNE
jgi:hypothetical protein